MKDATRGTYVGSMERSLAHRLFFQVCLRWAEALLAGMEDKGGVVGDVLRILLTWRVCKIHFPRRSRGRISTHRRGRLRRGPHA